MPYTWLLIDADGTLFDYDRAEAAALENTFAECGAAYEAAYLEKYQRINSRIWRELEAGRISPQALRVRRFELLFHAIELELSAETFSAAYLRQLAACSHLIEGAAEVVQALSRKYRLMIATNGLSDVQRPRLENSAIREYIADLVISEEVGAAKPEPAYFDVAFRRMGNPRKDEVLMIGDNLSADIGGAARYGIDTCWYNPAGLPRTLDIAITYEIQNLSELLRLLL
jgi:2-haloacid dehalogenase